MSIRVVAVAEAPVRKKGNRMFENVDWQAVMAAMSDPANKGKALIVTMTDPMWTTMKPDSTPPTPYYPKPEQTFAQALRYHFEINRTAATAYQVGKMEVVVRAMTTAEIQAPKKKRKGK